MSLFNTGLHYNVYLDIPDSINFSWNPIYYDTLYDVDSYINQLSVRDKNSVIVLWGVDFQINTNDFRLTRLNEFYHDIDNPMILFNGGIIENNILNFPVKYIKFFQQLSKKFYQPRSIVKEKSKKFLYSSTKDYPERRYILKTLYDVKEQGIIAYKCKVTDLANRHYSELEYSKINDVISLLDSKIPIVGYDDSIEFTLIPSEVINESYLSVITDTHYQSPIFFSEKIFNAMLYGHMFVYLGPAHSLKQLKEWGFKTWSHVIDESYDSIDDSYQRLCAVNNSLREYLSLDLTKISQIYQENLDIIEHNKELVLSTNIEKDVVSDMLMAIDLKNGRV